MGRSLLRFFARPRSTGSTGEARSPGERRFLSSLEASVVVVLVALAWIHWRIGGLGGTEWFTDLVETGVPIAAAGLCIRAGQSLTSRDGRAWRLLGLSAIAWALGQLVWSYLELARHRHPVPSPADLFYGASFLLAVIGLLSFEASPSGVGARVRAVIEGLMVCVSVFFVGWSITLGPSFHSATGSFLPKLVSSASAGTDIVLVALVVMVASRARNFRPFAVIALGIMFLAAADTASALTVLRGGGTGPGLVDVGWILGFLLVGLGAVTPGGAPGRVIEDRHGRLQGLIVYAAWPVVLAIGIWETVHGHQLEPVLKWSAIAMAALGLTRQILVTRESQALARDLERKVRARTAELAEREERFRSLLQNSSDVVMLLDAGFTIRYVTDSAERILGAEPDELIGQSLAGLLEDGSRDDVLAKLRDVARRHRSTAMVQFRLRRAGGATAGGGWVELETMVANLLHAPAVASLVLTARDVGERVELEGKLRTLAFHDSLTGLPNRTLFRDTVQEALAAGDDLGWGNCAVMLLDLDRFKNVNDSLGHHVGDQLLIAAARRIEGVLRAG
ncbi:MAG TPA: sensor domain-containing diguanylate cyclase, partial [Actinomycetota bacterium]|nr:sensor domain-containing diguanylate cyclase [Actinomycetota bacterium]